MENQNRSQTFLREAAAKHFVVMECLISEPDGSSRSAVASCFIVAASEQWWLITAGHVVRDLRHAKASNFHLHDQLAGHGFRSGVPFDFNPSQCPMIDLSHGDFAAWPLDWNATALLERGGIKPIGAEAWGHESLDVYELVLIGVPAESLVRTSPGRLEVNLTLIPLEAMSGPWDDGPLHPNAYRARLVQQPDVDGAAVTDIGGMSGGPIFGVKCIDGEERYFLVGIQSSWLRKSRVVTFFAVEPFLEILRRHVHRVAGPAPY